MKKIILLLAVAAVSYPALAQKAKKAVKSAAVVAPQTEEPQLTPQERVAQHEQKLIAPQHHMLIQWSGHWREEMKIWSGAGSEPVTQHLERESRMICDGRFMFSTTMGMMGHERYEAQSTIGYDNGKHVFTKVWIDNLGSGTLVLEGTMDENAKTVDFRGTTFDPISRREIKIHQILRITDPTSQTLEIYVEDKAGKEFKTIEVKSLRG